MIVSKHRIREGRGDDSQLNTGSGRGRGDDSQLNTGSGRGRGDDSQQTPDQGGQGR